jgi:hypothetical protein
MEIFLTGNLFLSACEIIVVAIYKKGSVYGRGIEIFGVGYYHEHQFWNATKLDAIIISIKIRVYGS